MVYEPLHHKYRPQIFADLVGQEAIATTLTNAIRQQRIAPAYLFTGPRGTGKTSSARILAKSLNCLSQANPTEAPCGQCEACTSIALGSALDVIEIDAASNTGVDNIRDLIEKAQFAPVQCRYKVYVIDECITGDAQIQTETGTLPIQDSRLLGQRVLSYNEQTQTWEYKTVTRWLDRGERSILSLHTDQGDLRCTHNHLIQTVRGWIKAQDLQAGDLIFSPMDTNLATVKSVRPAGRERVYDLEVEDNHNFVANGLSVHNCHMLSTAAFNALLKTLEEPPDRVVFVLATTDPQRVLPTIISRCQRFDFRRIPLESMIRHLSTIAAKETIDIVNPAITLVAQLAQGGLRDAESLLDQLSLLPPPVTPEAVWDLVGAVPERDLLALVQAIVADDPEAVLDRTRELMNRGREPLIVLQNLASFYRDLLIAKTAPQRGDMVAVTAETWQEMVTLAKTVPIATLLQGQQNLRSSESQLKNTTQPRLWLEVTLLGLLPSALVPIAPSPSSGNLSGVSMGATPHPIVSTSVPTSVSTSVPTSQASSVAAASPVNSSESSLSLAANTPVSTAPAIASTPGSVSPSDSPLENTDVSNPATPKPVSSPVDQDCASLWERTLARTRTASAKGLFSQQAQLIAFSNTQAIVAVRPKLLKLAETKVAPIQEAMTQVLGYPINIKLEPQETIAPGNLAPGNLTPGNLAPGTPPQPPLSPVPQVQTTAPPPVSPPPQTTNPVAAFHSSPNSSPSPHPPSDVPVQSLDYGQASASPLKTDRPVLADPPPPQPLSQLLETPPTPMAQIWNEDETLRAAKSLAQFFNGEVVADSETIESEPLSDENVPF